MTSLLSRAMSLAGPVRGRGAVLGSILALAIKSGGTLLLVLTFMVAARTSTPAAFGQLAVAFNALSFLAVVAILGQDTLFVRCWSEYFGRDDGLAKGAFWSGWRMTGIGVAIACTSVFVLGTFGPFGFTTAEVLAGCAFLAAQVALTYSSNTCRHVLNFVISETNRELTWRLVLLAVVAASLGFGLTPAVFFSAAACGMVLAILVQSVALLRGFPSRVARAKIRMDTGAWLVRARSMWVSASIEAATQYGEVMLLGVLVSPATAGGYFVSARIANAFAMLGTGLHTYTVSHAANLFFSAEQARLQGIFRSVMAVAGAMTTPILVVILLAGRPILNLFGPHYCSHFTTLTILAVASYTITMAGPASALLQTTGHERLYSRVILAALVVRTALLVVLAPRFGATGAAAAWAAVNAPVAIGLSLACRRLTGVDPSVLGVFRGARRDERGPAGATA